MIGDGMSIEVTYETLLDKSIVRVVLPSTAHRTIGVLGTTEYVYDRNGKLLGKRLREVTIP